MEVVVLKQLLVTALLFVCFVASASAIEHVHTDGNWWNSLTGDEQVFAMYGFIAGYNHGFMDGKEEVLTRLSQLSGNEYRLNHLTGGDLLSNTGNQLDRDVPGPAFSGSIGTYVDRVTDFYRDHPEKTSLVPVENLITCLADNVPESIRRWCDQDGM